jgi:hypothetical protein
LPTLSFPPLFVFCENQPKFELKSKVHQNKSGAKICELQNIFWWPELFLSGKIAKLAKQFEIQA